MRAEERVGAGGEGQKVERVVAGGEGQKVKTVKPVLRCASTSHYGPEDLCPVS